MKIRFLADADLNKAIVSGVPRREPAIDFLTAHAAGLRKMRDAEVLALAGEQQRALVSHDAATMPMHFREFTKAGMRSAGVFLIPQTLDIGTASHPLRHGKRFLRRCKLQSGWNRNATHVNHGVESLVELDCAA